MDPARPHDSLFHRAFRDPREAAALVRDALARDPRLCALVPYLDFDAMRPLEASMVDAADRPFRTDLLFEIPLAIPGKKRRRVVVATLLEHKRAMDPFTVWQTMRYQIRVIDWYRTQEGLDAEWPLVIALVVYHGTERWTAARQLRELFVVPEELPVEIREALRDLLPSATYVLHDLGAEPDVPFDPRKAPLLGYVALQFLRHLPNSGPAELELHLRRLAGLLGDLANLPNGRAFLGSLFWYLLATTRVEPEVLRQTIRTALPQRTGDHMLNPLQREMKRMHDEGHSAGLAKGMAKGLAEGIARGAAKTLLQVLEHRFGPLRPKHRARVEKATERELENWTLRAIDASTLAEVFAD